MIPRPIAVSLSVAFVASVTLIKAPAAAAAERVVPFPNERILTQAERRLALDTMAPAEKASIGAVFTDGARELVVSYSRKKVRVTERVDGTSFPEEIVESASAPSSNLTIPNEAVAGSAMKEDLYISLTVAKTRSTRPYEWRIYLYSEWRGPAGMNMTNSSWDTMAAAWAGSAYLYSQLGSGQYINGNFDLCKAPLDEWPSDGAANTGTAWSFHEWRPGFFVCPMNWGLIDVRIRTDSLVGRTDNVVFAYYHTFGGLQYDFTFSRTPSINVTPTNEQWALVLFGTYTH